MTRSSRPLWLGGILAAGVLLRIWGLPARELSYYDEGGHWRMGYAPAAALRACAADVARGDLPSREAARASVLRHGFPDAYFGAHHGYVAFESLVMAAAGLRDDAGFWVSAFWGSLTLLVVYRIGTVLGSPAAGLCAATLLAASPNHVFYSRAALAQATSVFFVYAGFFCLLRPVPERAARRSCLVAGILLGYGLTVHYNLFWTAPFALGIAAVPAGGRPRAALGRMGALVCGLAVFPLLFEGMTRAATPCLARGFPDAMSYFQEVTRQFSINTGGYSVSRSTPIFYVIHWVRTEGVLFAAAASASAAFLAARLLKERSVAALRWAALAGLVLVPHVLYAPLPLKGARTMLVAMPAAALCVAAWLARRPLPLRAAVLAAIVGGMLPMTAEVAAGRGPYKTVLSEIARRRASPVTVDDYPVIQTYAGRDDILAAQVGNRSWRDALMEIRRRRPGPHYLIAVRKDGRYGFDDPVWKDRFGIVREMVSRGATPVFSVPFGQPLAFDYVDETFRWDRLFGLEGVDYAVDVFDLGILP